MFVCGKMNLYWKSNNPFCCDAEENSAMTKEIR